jgi:hypothetical protein
LAEQIDEVKLREAMKSQGFDFDEKQREYQQSFGQRPESVGLAPPRLPSVTDVLTAGGSISDAVGKLIWSLPLLEMVKFAICGLDRIVNEHHAIDYAVQKCASLRWPDIVSDPDQKPQTPTAT